MIEMQEKEIEMTLEEGLSIVEIEGRISDEMLERAEYDMDWVVENPWGEFRVAVGIEIYGVQWQYVGLDEETGEFYDGEPDFEISCMWKE